MMSEPSGFIENTCSAPPGIPILETKNIRSLIGRAGGEGPPGGSPGSFGLHERNSIPKSQRTLAIARGKEAPVFRYPILETSLFSIENL
jgi:hypothetical protein